MMDNERHKRDFEEVREDCPWRAENGKCKPIKGISIFRECIQEECAPFHFRKFFEGRKY